MYSNKLATAIKVNGKVLREFKDTVYIPYGSEYTVLIKNLHTTRAVVNVFIDGENVVPGGLVVDPGREVDLERWVKNGNLTEGNRFKFIERTAAIEEGPRGIKLEDGLIRIEHQFEQPRPVYQPTWTTTTTTWNSTPYYGNIYPQGSTSEYKGVTDKFTVTASGATSQVNVNGVLRGVDFSKNGGATAQAASESIASYCAQNNIQAKSELHDGAATMDWCETGITVPGSKSEQKFQHVVMGTMESAKHSMVIKLLGDLGNNKPVTKPLTVKHKVKCVTCGRQNKHNAKFCTECGTALEIFA